MIKRSELSSQVVFGVSELKISLGECHSKIKNTVRIEDNESKEIVDLIFFESESISLIIKKLQELKKQVVSEEIRIKKESRSKKKEKSKND